MTLHPYVKIILSISHAGNASTFSIPPKRETMPLSALLCHSIYAIVETYAEITNVPESDIEEQIQEVGRWLAETEINVQELES